MAEDESIGGEIKSMLTLAFPIFLAMVSWVAMKVTDTALLGHAGKNGDTRYLDASAMSDLWTSSSGVFIQGGVLSIFCGQALGASKEQAKRGDSVASLASKRLVGIWLQVSISVVLAVSIPVLALWLVTGPVLRAMGQSEQIANDAWYYAGILSGAFPARIVFGQMRPNPIPELSPHSNPTPNPRQFFSAQKITHPEAVCSVSAMLLNLIFGLIMVLGVPIPGFDGFGFPTPDANPNPNHSIGSKLSPDVQVSISITVYCAHWTQQCSPPVPPQDVSNGFFFIDINNLLNPNPTDSYRPVQCSFSRTDSPYPHGILLLTLIIPPSPRFHACPIVTVSVEYVQVGLRERPGLGLGLPLGILVDLLGHICSHRHQPHRQQ